MEMEADGECSGGGGGGVAVPRSGSSDRELRAVTVYLGEPGLPRRGGEKYSK